MKVLFIDDEADLWVGSLRTYLARFDLQVVEESAPEQALSHIATEKPDVVLLDIMFPEADGRMEAKGRVLLASINARFPDLPVVMISSTLADASFGIDEKDFAGACFLFSKDRFAEEAGGDPYAELAHQLLAAVRQAGDRRSLDDRLGFIIGNTPRMKKAAEMVLQAAGAESTVLVAGESGTGKELIAQALHRLSSRADHEFVPVNCATPTAEVLESELFGHERGAFTGAIRDHRGYFEQAHRGTLFLDDVDIMSSELQERLLRVLQERKIRRMGSQAETAVDVRVVAATNKNLSELVERGAFRRDLYYRLHVIEIELPPLRERLGDIPALYRLLVNKLNKRLSKSVGTEPRHDVVAKLRNYSWPGNVRQLENTLEQAMVMARANVLTPSVLNVKEVLAAAATPQVSTLDMVPQILDGRIGWETLQDYQGEIRRSIFVELVAQLTRRDGRPPSSPQLAALINTTPGNMRRILSEAGIRLRSAAQNRKT